MTYDVVTIGSATTDIFADSESELIRLDTRLTHRELLAFDLGSKILVNDLNITTGGGGTNTATSFSRLGFRTGYLGKIGTDVQGDAILEYLKNNGIDFLGRREGQSGISIILNSFREDRTILAYKGTNNSLTSADIQSFTTPWIYLSSMLERSWQTVSDFIQQSDAKLAFNPSTYQAAMGYDALKAVINRASILVMNREEACALLGLDAEARTPVPGLLEKLLRVPGQTVVITDGNEGAWAGCDNEAMHGMPNPELEIIEATGAGDAFASTFTAARIRGKSLHESLGLGMTNAESVLSQKGAKEKLLAWEELQARNNSFERVFKDCKNLTSCEEVK